MSLLHAFKRCNSSFKILAQSNIMSKRHYARGKCVNMVLNVKGFTYEIRGEIGRTVRNAIHCSLVLPEYGICGGMPGCTTCHVIFSEEDYKKITPPDSLESDLLRHTIAVTFTSRLGCQTMVEECMEGMQIKLPAVTRDIRTI